MEFTLDDVKRALDAIPPKISEKGIISKGMLQGRGSSVEYTIHLGWDLIIAHLCDRSWSTFNFTLLRHIKKLEEAGQDVTPILEAAQLEDEHWRWLDKSFHYRGEGYKWFFLVAENYPQAACLVYQPKNSVAGAGKIFYIEYIATAPWNRTNAIAERVFSGVGSKLLTQVINYARNDLKLSPGFSLHSLPQAEKFYEKIGMTPFPQHDKQGLRFYEWVDPTYATGT